MATAQAVVARAATPIAAAKIAARLSAMIEVVATVTVHAIAAIIEVAIVSAAIVENAPNVGAAITHFAASR